LAFRKATKFIKQGYINAQEAKQHIRPCFIIALLFLLVRRPTTAKTVVKVRPGAMEERSKPNSAMSLPNTQGYLGDIAVKGKII
jgi:hypothetical protein